MWAVGSEVADDETREQLQTIDRLDGLLTENGFEYWLFGGWAVDFHLGRVTRHHDDVDVAVWQAQLVPIAELLATEGWVPVSEPDADGYTAFQRGGVRLEIAFLSQDEAGLVVTPLADGVGAWPADTCGDDLRQLDGVWARVVGLHGLVEDKSGPRSDPGVAAKDHADVLLLTSLL